MALPSLASGVDHGLAEHENTLNALAERLRALMANTLILADAQAYSLVNRIVRTRDAVEFDPLVDALLIRVGELIAKRTADDRELHRLNALTGPRQRSATKRQSHHAHGDRDGLSLPSRTLIRL